MSRTEWEDWRKFCERKTRFYGRKRSCGPSGDPEVRDFTGDIPGSMWVAEVERRRSLRMGREVEEPRSDDVGTSWYLG